MSQPRSQPRRSWLRRLVIGSLAIIAAIWIFIEEWLWDGLRAFMAWVGKLPLIHWVESRLAASHPYAALAAFVIPAAVLFPFKLLAFWLIAQGHGLLGLQVFLAAKIIGTALLARIFTLTKNQLMKIAWFARAYAAVMRWKEKIYAYVRTLAAWRMATRWMRWVRQKLRQIFGREKG